MSVFTTSVLNYYIIMICKNMEKCHPRSIICFLMYTGLTVIAFYLLIIGPIKDLVKHETTFTESLQNINGKIYEILGGY